MSSERPMRTARRVYALAVLALAAFTLYASTVPFDFLPLPLEVAWARFRERAVPMSWTALSRTDVIANALMFVPLGFALSGAMLFGRRSSGWRIATPPLVLVVSIAVSVLAEFVQIFTPDRIPSNSDIAAQVAGTLFGVLGWLAMGDVVTNWAVDTVATRREDRLSRVLLMYAVAWTFTSLAPFDVTVDVGELAARFRSGQITLLPSRAALSPWDVFVELLSTVPLGAFVLTWRRSRYSTVGAILVAALWVCVVEAAQVFLLSHSATALDALLGTFGASTGAFIGRRFDSFAAVEPQSGRTRLHAPALAFFCFWTVVLAVYHWRPYNFTLDAEQIRTKLATMSLIPFGAYVAGSYLNALSDLLTKIALAVPLGCGLGVAVRTPSATPVLIVTVLAAAGVFGGLEAGQLFLPARFPDITDVLIGLCGALAGEVLARWIRGPKSRERSNA